VNVLFGVRAVFRALFYKDFCVRAMNGSDSESGGGSSCGKYRPALKAIIHHICSAEQMQRLGG